MRIYILPDGRGLTPGIGFRDVCCTQGDLERRTGSLNIIQIAESMRLYMLTLLTSEVRKDEDVVELMLAAFR